MLRMRSADVLDLVLATRTSFGRDLVRHPLRFDAVDLERSHIAKSDLICTEAPQCAQTNVRLPAILQQKGSTRVERSVQTIAQVTSPLASAMNMGEISSWL
eukprot:3247242-Amphidinium_carterae.1